MYGNIKILIAFFFLQNFTHAQNISGIINSYGAVTNMTGNWDGMYITNASAFKKGDRIMVIQMKGAVTDTTNTQLHGDIVNMDNAGKYEFTNIASLTGSYITLPAALTNTFDFVNGFVQIVRVPRYCTPAVTGSITCPAWNYTTGTGGVIALEAGTLTLYANIDASEKGFAGGDFGVGGFHCKSLSYVGAFGFGGMKGESISTYINSMDALRGKQANGGGGSSTGNSGGGGGGNGGAGGFGGNQYNGCDTIDTRGIGGVALPADFSRMHPGGGGGGGFQDNTETCTPGGKGGGIIYISANAIAANNNTIAANGGNVSIISDIEGSGGGGAGGTIFLACHNITGYLSIKANGGYGGSNFNSQFVSACHGPGGGGGGGVFAYSPSSLPMGVVYSATGGTPGLIKNPASDCYNTSYSATAGANGISTGGLPAPQQAVFVPTLSITSETTICVGESVTLTATGASTFTWDDGFTGASNIVAPESRTTYTVYGIAADPASCVQSITTRVNVDACTGIDESLPYEADVILYPNPARTSLHVSAAIPSFLTIIDLQGRIFITAATDAADHEIDVSSLAPGYYILKVGHAGHTSSRSFIKLNN